MPRPNADPFQAIADPGRRQMLKLLSTQTMTINQLAGNFDMSRPAVSKHLRLLEEAGFIAITDIGRERHCLLKEDGFNALQEWVDFFDSFWNNKLKKLDSLLKMRAKEK